MFLKNRQTGETYVAQDKLSLVVAFIEIINKLFEDPTPNSPAKTEFGLLMKYKTVEDFIANSFSEEQLELVNFDSSDIELPKLLSNMQEKERYRYERQRERYLLTGVIYDFYLQRKTELEEYHVLLNNKDWEAFEVVKDNLLTEFNYRSLLNIIDRIYNFSTSYYLILNDSKGNEIKL